MRNIFITGLPLAISEKDLFLILNNRVKNLSSIIIYEDMEKIGYNYGFCKL